MRSIYEFVNRIIPGDCVAVMHEMPAASVDAVITDPPYLVNYHSTDGRGYQNDNPEDTSWLVPAFAQMYRVLKPDSFCVSFYGFPKAEACPTVGSGRRPACLRPTGETTSDPPRGGG